MQDTLRQFHGWLEIAMDGKARNAAQSLHEFGHRVADLLLGRAAGNIELDIMDLRYGDGAALPFHGAIRRDCCNDGAAQAILAELQRVRIAWIGVTLCVFRAVVVAEEGMMKPGVLDFSGVERRVRLLIFPLLCPP